MNKINFTSAAPYTTIQDFGRFQIQHLGISPSGVMDDYITKKLFELFPKNNNNIIEFAYQGPTFVVTEGQLQCAIGGITESILIKPNGNKIKIKNFKTINVFKDDQIVIGPVLEGVYGYLVFNSTIKTNKFFSSYSTNVQSSIGPKIIETNTELYLENFLDEQWDNQIDVDLKYFKNEKIKIHLGPQSNLFDNVLKKFFSSSFEILPQSNRMGIRLKSQHPLTHDKRILTEGVIMGTIQLPPDGNPIVLMKDHPATGGYPKIGIVDSEDLKVIAQKRFGKKINFTFKNQ